MFGTRTPFTYAECGHCESLYLQDVPEDLSVHYPEDYYSFDAGSTDTGLRLWVKRQLMRRAVTGTGLAGKWLSRVAPEPMMVRLMRLTGTRFDHAILDVGCGDGAYLRDLEQLGFRNLTGVDPFMSRPGTTGKTIRLLNHELSRVEGSFDLIMFNHAFEHVAHPENELREAAARLTADGVILIRVPVAGNQAWKQFGTDWIQLDAPRHLHLGTPRGMQLLAERNGLEIAATQFDSDAFMFWGSALYQKDVPLHEAKQKGGPGQFFSEEELKRWQQQAAACNQSGEADQAGYVLRTLP